MALRDTLASVANAATPEVLERFRQQIDPAWILEALEATGTASLRRRRLPAEQVIWLVLGMALLRDRSIAEVAATLDLVLPSRRGRVAATSAIAQAKDRLGEEPLQWLFDTCAQAWAHRSAAKHRWRGLALYGVDGTTLRVPDSTENREHFTLPSSGRRGEAAYPQLRMAVLMALRSHLIAAGSFGPYSTGEVSYAAELWQKLPDESLCIVDRGFFGAGSLLAITRSGHLRHWLTRAKSNLKWEVVKHLGKDDDLIEMKVSPEARRHDPSLPERWQMRALRYSRPGFRPQWLLTSLVDAEAYPAKEVATLYHERWELEQCYDEIKTEMLDREETIRSKSPMRVSQEIWGILLAYNLIRLEMERVADQVNVAPIRISFIAAMHLIREEWICCGFASPGAIPKHLRNLREKLARFILPERRSERRYPRAVKIKMSGYPRKRRLPMRAGRLK